MKKFACIKSSCARAPQMYELAQQMYDIIHHTISLKPRARACEGEEGENGSRKEINPKIVQVNPPRKN